MGVISYGSTTLVNIDDGDQGVGVVKTVPEYTLSTSASSVPSTATWAESKPEVDSSHYLWTRQRTDKTDGSHAYSTPVCDTIITGLISTSDTNTMAITNKIWRSDITSSISDYDTNTISGIRDTVSEHTQTLTGFTTRVANIESSVDTETKQRKAVYATCSTGAGTNAKVATCQNFVLDNSNIGTTISVRFDNGNTASSPTLNVNSTGAKTIKSYTGANLAQGEYTWAAGSIVDFIYDGQYWRLSDYGTTKRITSAESSITQNAENIELKVSKNGVISSINQSPESITIDADRVNVAGAAIFTSGRLSQTSLNSTYDALGSASTVQNNLNTEINQRKAVYGVCQTAAGTTAKTVTIDNFTLYTGATISVMFQNANTVTAPTLQVNSTGAKTIRSYKGTALTSAEYSWVAGSTISFTYDGTYWRMQDGGALQAKADASASATNAANSATAAAEVMGGYTILWNYSAFGTSDPGEAYICLLDPSTGTRSDSNGWVKWNGTKRTITKGMANPGTILPYNIPIYIVCRLSSASATTGTNYMVWHNSGWKYSVMQPSAVGGSWTWNNDTDIILGKFVEPSSEGQFTECEIYNPPWTAKQVSTDTVTASSANSAASSAQSTANSAASEEQYIYISKASGTSSVSGTTTWVTNVTGNQNTWTTKRPVYNTSYPVLFVAKQKKTMDGTVTCTTPVKDDTTTVIDGGHITTGTIDASQVTVDNISASNIKSGYLNADRIAAGSLNIGKFDTVTQANIREGNLIKDPEDLTTSNWSKESGITVSYDSSVGMFKILDSSHTSSRWGIYQDITISPNTTYTFSITLKAGSVAGKSNIGAGTSYPSTNTITSSGTSRQSISFTTGSSDTTWRLYLNISPTATNQYAYFLSPRLVVGTGTDISSYITDIDNRSGITIKAIGSTTGSSSTTDNYLKLNPDIGLEIYNKGAVVGKYSSTGAVIGKTSANHAILDSDGLTVKSDNSTEVASFGYYGATIGQTDKAHLILNSNSLIMYDKDGESFFEVVDLRDDSSGLATLTEIYYGDGSNTQFRLTSNASDTDYTVKITDLSHNDVTSSYTLLKKITYVSINTAPPKGFEITITYTTRSDLAKCYTLGSRISGATLGPMSVVLAGSQCRATARFSIASGHYSEANGEYSTACGNQCQTIGIASHAEGSNTNASGDASHAEGWHSTASGHYSHAEGYYSTAEGQNSHAEGYSWAIGINAHAEGELTQAEGQNSHSEGQQTKAKGAYSHAEGYYSTAYNNSSHAEGNYSAAYGMNTHAEGDHTSAYYNASHAEGYYTSANYYYAHAEGDHTYASGWGSHVEGGYTQANSQYAHAEGYYNSTSGLYSHVGGSNSSVSNTNAFAHGSYLSATGVNQFVIGKYNTADANKSFIIGGGSGTSASARKNIFTVDWNGGVDTTGNIWINCSSRSAESQCGVVNVAGNIYLYSQTGANGARGLYTKNSSNAAQTVIGINQDNKPIHYGSIQGISDLKRKNIIDGYDWKVDDFINGLKPIAYHYIDPDGNIGKRIHMGFGAQDVSKLSKDLNMGNLSVYSANIKNGDEPGLPYNGEDIEDEKLDWYLDYTELVAPMVLEIQRLMKRVDELEKKLELYEKHGDYKCQK